MNNKIPSYHSTISEVCTWLETSKKNRAVFNRRRAKKLQDRGEYVNYSIDFGAWLWVMK